MGADLRAGSLHLDRRRHDRALEPEIVWVGTGEANIFRSSMAGAGVYKSLDGGKTWKHMGLAGTHTIPRIVIHPSDPDVVYVASSGHEWKFNPERGVYKTTNGGESWELAFIRKRWNDPRNEPDYRGSGIHETTDGGISDEEDGR